MHCFNFKGLLLYSLVAFFSSAESRKEQAQRHQPFPVPDDSPIPISENSVPNYKINKLQQMGFQREEAIIALNATTGNIEQATELLYTKQVGNNATVLPNPPPASSDSTG